jgi:RNase P protein component
MEANDVYAKEGGDGGGGSDGGFSGGWLDDGTDGGFEANSQTDVLRGRRVRLLDNDKKTAPVCGCGLTMQRRRLLSHQRNECVKRLVTCAFNEHGCTTAVPWDAIVTHDTTYMARHLALVSRKLALVSRVAAIETTRDWTARYGHIAYRFGGDDGKTELGSALSYDILGATRHKHLATWMSLPNLPTPRGFVACARWRNRVYVTGYNFFFF